VLDVGCGIGGPARFFAAERGWQVEGIELTAEYVEVAKALSRGSAWRKPCPFRQASATALPFADATFDGAYMLHVGMNIADKKAVFAEVRRVLKPGRRIRDLRRHARERWRFCLSRAVVVGAGDQPHRYAGRLQIGARGGRFRRGQGAPIAATSRFRSMQQRVAQAGHTIGLPVVMGATAAQKLANMRAMIEGGVFAPCEIIARAA
jgi:SAM-dependent methyltransferase